MAAENLHNVRQVVGADLVEQVERITTELEQQITEVTPWVDKPLLRGIPVNRTKGVITDSTVPGSDEHLDRLDNIRRSA